MKEDQKVTPPQAPMTIGELETQLLQSISRLDHGEGIDGEAMLRRFRERIKTACLDR
jgi:hypothetical protein